MFFLSQFHIKLFMLSEAASGNICSFSTYTGKGTSDLLKGCAIWDPDCSRTTKTVIGHLDKVQISDTGRLIYFGNYYSSSGLLKEMFKRKTYAFGIVRSNRRNLLDAVIKPNWNLESLFSNVMVQCLY